jgi:hypothetical protein
MDLHEDHADHFEFALKYIYTLRSKTNEIEIEAGTDDDLKHLQLLMGVYTVADKYEIERLISPVQEKFREILAKAKDHEVLCSVIKTHYTTFGDPGHAIGNIVATSLLDHHPEFTHNGPLNSVCHEFSALATDIITNMGRLRCQRCDSTNFIGRAREETAFQCSYCPYGGNLGKISKDSDDTDSDDLFSHSP